MRIGGLPRPSIARPVLGARPIRVEDGKHRYCGIPTGDNGIILFCTRVLFPSLQISTDGRPMAAPTGAELKPVCHLENGNVTNITADNNRAVAI